MSYKFSIITITLNSEKFIKRNIHSVKNQTYQNYEHILIDGKSKDKTMEIILNHQNHFSKIISEKDNGIWDAMNKGLKVATGDIVCFLNSDDFFYENALEIVNKYFNKNKIDFLFGTVKKYKIMHGYKPWKIKWSFGFYTSHSVGFFIKRDLHLKVGYYDTKYLSADLNFFYKMISDFKLSGMATSKNEVIGVFEKGGFSSKVDFLTHLKDLNKIRIDNNQNFFFVYALFFYKIIKNLKKIIKIYILKKKNV